MTASPSPNSMPQPAKSHRTARLTLVMLGVILAVLHQDWWFKGDGTLVFHFLPVSLFYHLCFSVAVAGLWGLMSKFAWPTHIEEFAALGDVPDANGAVPATSLDPESTPAPSAATEKDTSQP